MIAPTVLAITFALGPQQYALPLDDVREIVKIPGLLALAGAPPVVCGLLNLHGQHVPILDGRMLVGAPALFDLNLDVIIIGTPQPQLGLVVDRTCDVVVAATEPLGELARTTSAPFLRCLWHSGQDSGLLLDLTALLAAAAIPLPAEPV